MDHTHIVQATQLESYSDTRASESVIPELIYQLVRQSVPDASECRIPYGDLVNQPGWDGLVDTVKAFGEFVPAGRSYWEMGTGENPQDKATQDYRKRKEELSERERSELTFVFVTPRSASWTQSAQEKWTQSRSGDGWKSVRVMDGVKLANWLREFPAIGRWMASKIPLSRSLGGLSTPAERWNLIVGAMSEEPKLPPRLFVEGREHACEALQAVFEGRAKQLLLFAESSQDVFDFVAGYLETLDDKRRGIYAGRCLYVMEDDAWRSVVESRKAHVLVADARLELESDDGAPLLALAGMKGHSVVVPLCGAWPNAAPEIVRLRSPSQAQMEQVFRESGFSEVRARELASFGGDRLSALLRHLRGLGAVPPYATWGNARLLAQSGLVGKWDATNPSDVTALENLLGKEYGEWIETLRADVVRSDTPLVQRNEKWSVDARGEAWNALGHRLNDADLDRFLGVAVSVLSEQDPRFELPKEEQFAAGFRGKRLAHSKRIREGLAETLALLGSRGQALSSCSQGKAETTAVLAIRQILGEAPWERWASLDGVLPLLAEAAPDEFLDAVELALIDLPASPFHNVFAQEGGGLGWNYMSGLLWALETLAWNPDLLSRACVILADLSSIDPGGRFANRPLSTLVEIVLPWHFQTCAPLEGRKAAVEAVMSEQPAIGWKLVLALLPHSFGFAMGSRQPTWRSYIPSDWSSEVSRSEYWAQTKAYTEIAIGAAAANAARLEELIERWGDLEEQARQQLVAHLASTQVAAMHEDERIRLWDKATDIVHRHRKFVGAKWAMAEESAANLEAAANALAPALPELMHRRLFNKHGIDLFDENGDFEAQATRIDSARQAAVLALLDAGGIAKARAFARTIAHPDEVGVALGRACAAGVEPEIMPELLETEDEVDQRFISGFVWGRLRLGWAWIDEMLEQSWTVSQKANFLRLLPFQEETWERVSRHLGPDEEARYWRSVLVNPYGPDRDLSTAIRKLVEHGRADAALKCVDTTIRRTTPGFDSTQATHVLLAVLAEPSVAQRLEQDAAVNVIKQLQVTPGVDPDALFAIEWNFLPWLDRFSGASPKTLENRLASDPAFFAEVVALVFRSKNRESPVEPPSERAKGLARNAYGLLSEWRICPGQQQSGSFSGREFETWLQQVKTITTESGHLDIALLQVGHMLTHAPADPGGLWIHHAVAAALNDRAGASMRSGFTTALYNSRGVHGFSAGSEERQLAEQFRGKAEALDRSGYSRFATAIRELAAGYDREAERDEARDPLEQ